MRLHYGGDSTSCVSPLSARPYDVGATSNMLSRLSSAVIRKHVVRRLIPSFMVAFALLFAHLGTALLSGYAIIQMTTALRCNGPDTHVRFL
jgi:hypothetical protein